MLWYTCDILDWLLPSVSSVVALCRCMHVNCCCNVCCQMHCHFSQLCCCCNLGKDGIKHAVYLQIEKGTLIWVPGSLTECKWYLLRKRTCFSCVISITMFWGPLADEYSKPTELIEPFKDQYFVLYIPLETQAIIIALLHPFSSSGESIRYVVYPKCLIQIWSQL